MLGYWLGRDARNRILDGEYRLLNGTTVVANNKADLTDGTLNAAINLAENGGPRSEVPSDETTHAPGLFPHLSARYVHKPQAIMSGFSQA